MTTGSGLIPGGFILTSRKLLKSGIMEKPPLFLKLWMWMLLQASHKDHGDLKRGQFFASLAKMQKAMSFKIGYRVVTPTVKEIRCVTKFLTKVGMMGTTKVTHGLIITICNYDYYQNPENYEGHNEGQGKGHNINKNGINTISRAFECEFFSVSADQDEKYRQAYPGIDVQEQYKAMAAWLMSNPTKHKTERGYPRFINSWLSREYEKLKSRGEKTRTWRDHLPDL